MIMLFLFIALVIARIVYLFGVRHAIGCAASDRQPQGKGYTL